MAAKQQSLPVEQAGGGPAFGGVIAVIGKADSIAHSVEEALEPEHYRFEYHHSPDDLLNVSCEGALSWLRNSHGRAETSPSPTLFLFNLWASARAETEAGLIEWQTQCLKIMGELDKRCPRTPILVVADELRQRRLIEDALEMGADEVLGTAVAAIKQLVQLRVRTVLKSVSYRYWSAHTDVLSPPSAITAADADHARTRLTRAAESLPTHEARAAPLADLLGISVPSLRAESGRLDAKCIAAKFGISLSQLAKATPVTRQALSETPDSARVQPALDPFARTWGALSRLLPEDQIRKWLNARHERMDDSTPLEALLDGRAERVARMLESVRDGGVA